MVPENSSLHLDFIFIIQSLDDFSQRPDVLLLALLAACEEARSDPAAPVQRSLKKAPLPNYSHQSRDTFTGYDFRKTRAVQRGNQSTK